MRRNGPEPFLGGYERKNYYRYPDSSSLPTRVEWNKRMPERALHWNQDSTHLARFDRRQMPPQLPNGRHNTELPARGNNYYEGRGIIPSVFPTTYPSPKAQYSNDLYDTRSETVDRPPYPWANTPVNTQQDTQEYRIILGLPEHQRFLVSKFSPELYEQNAIEWLDEIHDAAKEYNWSEDVKFAMVFCKSSAPVRQWYLKFGLKCESWNELTKEFTKAFPPKNYYGLLCIMLARKKEKDEILATYFNDKVELLDKCEIKGNNAISCIIAGLTNVVMKRLAEKTKYQDPDELFRFLNPLFP